MPADNLKLADEFAEAYDENVLKNNWNGPLVLFNLRKIFILMVLWQNYCRISFCKILDQQFFR